MSELRRQFFSATHPATPSAGKVSRFPGSRLKSRRLRSGLKIHSSRRRFAARLNSDARGAMTLRKLHGLSALLLSAYVVVHIANHLVGLASIEAHIAFMHAFRSLYRIPAVEAILLTAIAFQICSGITFLVRGWKQRQGFVPWLQVGSGAYLVFFFLNHVGAILFGRAVLNLDTNFYFAAAGFYVPPFQFFFAPYYFLAVLAFFAHLGCALYWQLSKKYPLARGVAVAAPIVFGFTLSSVIVLTLAGVFYPVEIPPEYKATYGQHP